MTATDPRPAAPSDEARELLAEAAADYSAAEEHRRHHLNNCRDAAVRARATRAATDHNGHATTASRVTT